MTWNNIKLETVTPIHIGNGEEYAFLDYFVKDGAVNILNADLLFEELKDIEIINQMSKDIEAKIVNGQAQVDVKDFFSEYDVDVSKHISKKVKTNVLPSRRVRIKKFINQNGRCYIPGSSIKGVFRTSYIFDYFDKHIDKLIDVLGDHEIRPNQKFSRINEIAIGKIQDDFFRHLLVSDSGFIDEKHTSIIETKRYNNKRQEYGVSVYLEVIDADKQINFSIKINKEFGKTIDDLKEYIMKLGKTVSDYEKNNLENAEFLKKFYRQISKYMNENKTIYMNVGFGGGYLSKTIYLLLWKHNKDLNLIKSLLPTKKENIRGKFYAQKVDDFWQFPRTKTAYNNMPVGWIKLNFSEHE